MEDHQGIVGSGESYPAMPSAYHVSISEPDTSGNLSSPQDRMSRPGLPPRTATRIPLQRRGHRLRQNPVDWHSFCNRRLRKRAVGSKIGCCGLALSISLSSLSSHDGREYLLVLHVRLPPPAYLFFTHANLASIAMFIAGVCVGTVAPSGIGFPLALKSSVSCVVKCSHGQTGNVGRAYLDSGDAADMEDVMAKVIRFYVLDLLSKGIYHVARTEPGKVIEFRTPAEKDLVMQFRDPSSPNPDAKKAGGPTWTFCI